MTKKTKTPSEDAVQAWAGVMRVSQYLLIRVEADLKSAGLPPLSWYDALLELKRAGSKGLRPFQLQREMLLAQYNLSRLVERLVKASYVERLPSEVDGRGQILRITRSGRDLLRRMWPAYEAAIQEHFANGLDSRDFRELSRLLSKIRR